jgi:hypothetical protein
MGRENGRIASREKPNTPGITAKGTRNLASSSLSIYPLMLSCTVPSPPSTQMQLYKSTLIVYKGNKFKIIIIERYFEVYIIAI